jgi:formylglycine-generating enzyme required for sulfatase activity
MARDRNDRYASAALLRDDLIAFLENEEVSAAPDTVLQRTIKWVRRNRRQVQTGAVSGAAVLVLLLTIWFGWRAWTIHSLFNQAQAHLEAIWTAKQDPRLTMAVSDDDPYRATMQADARRQRATVVRAAANAALDPLRRILEISPGNARARLMMAEAYMEMWRLALEENNNELARATRRDVETYAPNPSPFAAELNGFGSAHFVFDAPGTESYLFSFEQLHSHDAKFHQLPVRLIPVPFDLKRKQADDQFIRHEQERIAKGQGLPPEKHSIFNLDPTAASRIAGSDVNLADLPPGSYMLLVRAAGRLETRLPFRMDRSAKLDESIRLPKPDEIPPGFFYMAGGNVIVGGTTAGAVPPHAVEVPPALIYHDEISMGDYGEFLRALVRSGRAAEARQRVPRDFGKPLALLTSGGELVPADRSDPQAFAKSPVRGVSLKDARAYIEWRSQRDGFRYRLPHDWEWEAACRGADGRTYSWGDHPGKGLAVVTQGYGDTGSGISWRWEDYKDESPWGIHNLAGGAAEWTDSLYDPKAGPKDPVFGQYTIRGNAWALPPTGLECAFRTSGQPDYFHPTIGFRIALDYPPVRLNGTAEPAPIGEHQH